MMTQRGVAAAGALFLAMILSWPQAPRAQDAATYGEEVLLDIPDRAWDPERDDNDEGWCGETCVQMAMAYFGVEVTQQEINEAAEDRTPGLVEENIDQAMDALGVAYEVWDEESRDMDAFLHWIRTAIRRGQPVLAGVKFLPDEHPDWLVDHFVLIVGYDPEGLIMNTQLDVDGQIRVSYAQLESDDQGYSFMSGYGTFFARAITGVR